MIRFALVIVIAGAAACGARKPVATPAEPFPGQQIIGELQEFEQDLGLAPTGNFKRYAETPRARFRCYFAGKLDLPPSYDRLGILESDEPRCAVDEETHDVFFYAIEVVATGSAPVSPSLAQATLERMLVVVPHEDFHNQRESRRAAPEIAEAGATLIGFLTARAFAQATYGGESETFRRLEGEARLFLEKARVVNAFYDRVSRVYSAYRSGALDRETALRQKADLFAALGRECAPSAAVPASFNPCPGVLNNAGLAFDRTYTRYYPFFFELHAALGADAGASIAALKRILQSGPKSEADLLDGRVGRLR